MDSVSDRPNLGRAGNKRPLLERGWRYTIIATICAVSNYLIMVAVEQAGGHYLIGTVIAFSVVTPAAYMLHSCFTFSEPARWQAFFRFALSIAATYPAVLLMLAVLCSGLGLSVAIAIPIATVILFAWNFVAAHWAILPRVRHPAPQPQPYREETSRC